MSDENENRRGIFNACWLAVALLFIVAGFWLMNDRCFVQLPSVLQTTGTLGSPTLLGEDWVDHEPPSDIVVGSTPRTSCWSTARARYIADKDADGLPHDVCAVCLTRDDLNVHHVVPFHVKPELECDPDNFITLCREHHFRVGHDPDLDGPLKANWKSSNPNVRRDAARLRKKTRPQKD